MLDRTIWWHVYPLAALGAPIRDTKDAAHRLRGLEPVSYTHLTLPTIYSV